MSNETSTAGQQTADNLKHSIAKLEQTERKILQNPWVKVGGWLALLAVICGAVLYFYSSTTRVGIDTSVISAPTIDLSPAAPGVLTDVYVKTGDSVPQDAVVAKVGDSLIKTKVSGVIIAVNDDIGKTFNPGQAVVSMIDPTQLRVVSTIDENKGLDRLAVGQRAFFTVDAFGSKQYDGVVDEISPTSHQSGVVFNISDQRQTQQFDIKIRFDAGKYPELRNGMSAKATIFTK